VELLSGADWREYVDQISALGGNVRGLESGRWKDYWVRTWAARGLLHVWDDKACRVLRRGLRDEHWRVVEMSLKICRAHDVSQVGAECVSALQSETPRVRAAAVRALAVIGDVEHIERVEALRGDVVRAVADAATKAVKEMRIRLDHHAR
jgi:HEAT repeat protein